MDKNEALKLLKEDVAKFNEVWKDHQEPFDLGKSDFKNAKLKGADLRGIDFSGASFQKADLSDAIISGCTLTGTDFQGANLQGANFHHSKLRNADMRGAAFTPLTPRGKMCLNPNSFDGTHWDKSHLEQILGIINLNADWEIKYQIVPKKKG